MQDIIFESYSDPKTIELKGLELMSKNNVEEGIKLLLKAGILYEQMGENEQAGRIYYFLGKQYLDSGDTKTASQFLKRSAYYYVKAIEEKAVSINTIKDVKHLDKLCSMVLLIFQELGEYEKIWEYAVEFGKLFEEIANENKGMFRAIILEYAYLYYKFSGDSEKMHSVIMQLLDHYESEIRKAQQKKDYVVMGEYYRKSAYLTLELEGFGDNYVSLMKDSGKHFENAGKHFYAQGNLYKTGKYLVEAEYSYLLAGDERRAKLIANNVIKILKQQLQIEISKKEKNDEAIEDILLHLSKAYIGVGLIDEAMRYYKQLIEDYPKLSHRFKIRYAVVLYAISTNREKYLRELTTLKQLLMRTYDDLQLLEGIQNLAMRIPVLRYYFAKIDEAEGVFY